MCLLEEYVIELTGLVQTMPHDDSHRHTILTNISEFTSTVKQI